MYASAVGLERMKARARSSLLVVGLPPAQIEAWRAALPGADVASCPADGLQAVSRVVGDRPDALLLAADTAQIDGYALCALMKNNPEFRATRVILSLAEDSAFEETRARLAGADQTVVRGEPTPDAVASLRTAPPRSQ